MIDQSIIEKSDESLLSAIIIDLEERIENLEDQISDNEILLSRAKSRMKTFEEKYK
jgi:predicted  nucleic acid-binding Zn-ribbon protein